MKVAILRTDCHLLMLFGLSAAGKESKLQQIFHFQGREIHSETRVWRRSMQYQNDASEILQMNGA